MKLFCKCIFFIVIGTFVACGEDGALSGTWEGGLPAHATNEKCLDIFKFSGKSFVRTHCVSMYVLEDGSPHLTDNMADKYNDGFYTEEEFTKKEFVEKVSVSHTTLHQFMIVRVSGYEFFRVTTKGTYSISAQGDGNKIEFVLSDGTVKIYDIAYTENTMKYGEYPGFDYIRSGKKR